MKLFTDSSMKKTTERRRYLFAVAAGLIYGLSLRLIFHGPQLISTPNSPPFRSPFYPNDLWVMTAGFLVVVTFVMGWIAVTGTASDDRFHWAHWIFTPWLAVLLGDLCVLIAGMEGWICMIFAIPITLAISSIGGITAGLIGRGRLLKGRSTTACLALLPFLLAGIEMQLNAPLEVRTVQTSILIHAPASRVWENIERVPAISPTEIPPTWTHSIGFPLPVEATLDHEGVGGIRHASFQGGLLFIETIDRWVPGQAIGFKITADTAHIPPTTLDEHVTIGGRYFDVLNGEYRLEPLPDGDILLHLSSQERLSTDFNAYAALWSDAVMKDLQQSILQVVKNRCETDSHSTSATLNP